LHRWDSNPLTKEDIYAALAYAAELARECFVSVAIGDGERKCIALKFTRITVDPEQMGGVPCI